MRGIPAEQPRQPERSGQERVFQDEGSSVEITGVSPGVGIPLRIGDRVGLRVDASYTLTAESAMLGLVVQAADGSSIAQTTEVVLRGSGKSTFELDFTVPPTGMIQIFVPLSPQGRRGTAIVDTRAFKVVPAESGQE